MRAVVPGAAAGGGFPQWNSNADACRRARAGDSATPARSQTSLAVSAGSENWFLLNASPDLRQQIAASAFLHPRHGLRSSPIAGVVLTGGDVDAIAGLLTLRERQPFTVYATARIHAVLDANPIFDVLARDIVARQVVPVGQQVALDLPGGGASGLALELFHVPGKPPLYLERPGETPEIAESDDTVGAAISDGVRRLFFIPGCAAMTGRLAGRLRGAEAVFFDGTLWRGDEMIRAGTGTKTGLRMGHMSVSGPDGTIAAFAGLGVRRKILLHINNSNPVLSEGTPERAAVEAAGWQVAFDGLEINL